MIKLLDKKGNLNKKSLELLVEKVFNFANGKINPINPTAELLFVYGDRPYDPNVKCDFAFAGMKVISFDVNMYAKHIAFIKPFMAKLNPQVFEIMVKGDVVAAIIHELSHMEQQFGMYYYLDKDTNLYTLNTTALEYANESNTLAFIAKYQKDLVKTFGAFNLQMHNVGCPYMKFAPAEYHAVQGKYDKANYVISMMCGKSIQQISTEVDGLTDVIVEYQGIFYNPLLDEGMIALDKTLLNCNKRFETTTRVDSDDEFVAYVIELTEVADSKLQYEFIFKAA